MSSKNKKVSEFSADYRGAFEDAAHEKESPVAPQDDGEDFLPDSASDSNDGILTKWTDELEPETAGEEEPKRKKAAEPKKTARRRGKHRYGVAVGSLVLALALVGVVFIAASIGQQIYRAATDDSKLRAYDTFLTPVVMQDPQPFASPDKADDEFVLNASLWKTIMVDNGTNYTNYDDAGRLIIPLGDVVDACKALFGPDCQLQAKTPAAETFFTYDTAKNEFHVALYSSDSTVTPYTESAKKQGDSTVLRVGYVSPTDAWRTQTSSSVSAPKPTKYMEYVLKTNPNTNQEYIYSVQAVKD